jgi:hypothetical protein
MSPKKRIRLLEDLHRGLSDSPLINAVLECNTLWLYLPLRYRKDYVHRHPWLTATGKPDHLAVKLFTLQCLSLDDYSRVTGEEE